MSTQHQKAPAFQFYYRDFMHAVRRFTKDEIVEYLFMLFEQADSPTGSIAPAVFTDEVSSDRVREKFEEDANGFFNVRMRDILHTRDKYKQSRIKNLKGKDHMEAHMDGHMEDEVEEEDRSKKKEEGKGKKKIVKRTQGEQEPLVWPFMDDIFINRWQSWRDYKKEQFRFTYRHIGEQAALKKIGTLSQGNLQVALAIIERSMANGWQGLFPLDKKDIQSERQAGTKEIYDGLISEIDESLKSSDE